jgi:predicted nucleic acid-binding protein
VRAYIDTCCLQRPLDDQTQPRIRVETEAILAILASAQAKDFLLLSSDALEYEIGRIPDEQRRYEVMAVLALATERLTISNDVQQTAEALESQGIDPMDAVHLALASVAKADFFATCDDRLLRKGRKQFGLSCKVVSVFDLLLEVTK